MSELKRLKELEEENRRLKTLVADLSLDIARRGDARFLIERHRMSEWRKVALKAVIEKNGWSHERINSRWTSSPTPLLKAAYCGR